MIKSFFILAVMIAVAMQGVQAQAPIPNGNFEQWDGNTPTGWTVDNAGPYEPVTKSSDAHSGSFAFEGIVVSVQGISVIPPLAYSGTSSSNPGFPYADHP